MQTYNLIDISNLCENCDSATCLNQNNYFFQFQSLMKDKMMEDQINLLYNSLVKSQNFCERTCIIRVLKRVLKSSNGYDLVKTHEVLARGILNIMLKDDLSLSYNDVKNFVDKLSEKINSIEAELSYSSQKDVPCY